MAIKKRTKSDNIAIENLAKELADKPYGEEKENDTIARTTITLPSSLLFRLEDLAKENKRNKRALRSVSALVRDCIERSLEKE